MNRIYFSFFIILLIIPACQNNDPTSPPREIINPISLVSPLLVSPLNVSYNNLASLNLIWRKCDHAESYSLQVSTNNAFSDLVYYKKLTDTVLNINLNRSTTYYWRVNSNNGKDSSAWSDTWFFHTGPPAPILSSPANNSQNVPLNTFLSWNPDSSSESCYLQVSTTNTFSNLLVNKSGLFSKSFYFNNLIGGTTYYWRINSSNSYGLSPWSDTYNFTTIVTGSFFVQSIPSGAHIWVDGVRTDKITPDHISNLLPGPHSLKLTLNIYEDSSTVIIASGQQTFIPTRVLSVSNVSISNLRSLQIGSFDPAAFVPDGMLLKTGEGRFIESQSDTGVDIRGTGYGLSDMSTENGRSTFFIAGTSNNFYDNLSSPLYSPGNWSRWFTPGTNYFYIYDNDHHYSKMIKTGSGQYNRPWIEVIWIYNNREDDPRF